MKEDLSLCKTSLTGKELVNALSTHFGSLNEASAQTGLDRSTLQKWRCGDRNPSPRFRSIAMAFLNSESPKDREARILHYQQQVTKSGRIKWIKRD